MEKTLAIVKPDGVERGLIGEVLSRYERMGLRMSECKMITADKETLKKHYAEHAGKPFYDSLVSYMMRSPIVVMILEGDHAVNLVRKANGCADPLDSAPGTIRGDFSNTKSENIVHASDSQEAANREIDIWF